MTIKSNTHTPTLAERIAVHVLAFPLNKPCVNNVPSDQLLNDVLNKLHMFYPGAYADLSPILPLVTVPEIG